MNLTAEYLDNLPVHFVLCTERTGSSLLSLMLNLHSKIICPSEEQFALYFAKKYSQKVNWTHNDIEKYVEEFCLLFEKNIELYFSDKQTFLNNLKQHREILNYSRLIKLSYLHFIEMKDKSEIEVIVDKQIKYFFHLPALTALFPSAKFIVLTRDVRDNIISKKNRALNWNQNPFFLAYLWSQSYSNINQLQNKSVLIVKFEDFIAHTESTLTKICHFLNQEFQTSMLQTDGVFNRLIDSKKERLDKQFVEKLKDFHSGLNSVPNTKKIGVYKEMDARELQEIESICGDLLVKFDYELTEKQVKSFSFKKIYFSFLAKCYRAYLLKSYLLLPLSIKVYIKKIRRKKINV